MGVYSVAVIVLDGFDYTGRLRLFKVFFKLVFNLVFNLVYKHVAGSLGLPNLKILIYKAFVLLFCHCKFMRTQVAFLNLSTQPGGNGALLLTGNGTRSRRTRQLVLMKLIIKSHKVYTK